MGNHQDIFLPYGLNQEDQMVHISEVESGQTSLRCPFCQAYLIARKGKRLSHHFAHKSNSCKHVLSGEMHVLFPTIPFYSDFFSTQLSPAERQALQILYEAFGLDLFYRKGKQDSAFHILFKKGIQQISRIWDKLVEEAYLIQKGNWYQLTKLAEAGLALLPLNEFASIQAQRLQFFEIFLDSGTEKEDFLRKKVYENLKNRLLYAKLYCLHIPATKQKEDVWKIGLTTRSAQQRLQELRPVIKAQFGEERAKDSSVIWEAQGYGRLEGYIKKRFSTSQLTFSYKEQLYTEFFQTLDMLKELKGLRKKPIA
ncbi:MAG: GIY-YIG nuclease family protein [Bacteroidota bacterium]